LNNDDCILLITNLTLTLTQPLFFKFSEQNPYLKLFKIIVWIIVID